jgi:hypothetical protein
MNRTVAVSLAEVVTAPIPSVEREILGSLGLTPEVLRESEQLRDIEPFGRYLESPPAWLREMVDGLPVPGWLKPGLPLLDVLLGEPYRIIRVGAPAYYVAKEESGEESGPYPISGIRGNWECPVYFECDDCRKKPGSPDLCASCLERRTQESKTGKCALPPFCPTSYHSEGLNFDHLLVMSKRRLEESAPKKPARPSRFNREDLL